MAKKLVPFGVLSFSKDEKSHIDAFFAKLTLGEVFHYMGAFMGEDVAKMAAERGITIRLLNCSETQGEFGARVEKMGMTREDKAAHIFAASKYRSGNDSCNSFYMGSMATCQLIAHLGGVWPHVSVETALAKATDAQIDAALAYCKPYIDYMKDHPMKNCPCCGQLSAA